MTVSIHAHDGTQPLLEVVEEYDSDSSLLLDDHPLRSHPTECRPGLWTMLQQCYVSVRDQWGDRIFSFTCLLLMFGVMVQFLSLLPNGISYIFFREHYSAQAGFVHWPAEFDGQSAACIAYNPRSHPDAIRYAIAARCKGIKADIWLQGEELYVGTSNATLRPHLTLRKTYLDPLLQHLEAKESLGGSSQAAATDQFVLFLEFRSPVRAGWPYLLTELQSLNDRGYLAQRNGSQITSKAVRIAVVGDDHVEHVYEEYQQHPLSPSIFMDGANVSKGPDSASKHPDTMAQPYEGRGSQPRPSWKEWKNTTTAKAVQHTRLPLLSTTMHFGHEVGTPHRGRFSRQQLDLVRAHIDAAHARGLQARFEGIPCGSQGMSRLIWRILVKAGADFIDVDWTGCPRQRWRHFLTIGSS
ncbi:uncharacterized protein BP01DRAFT_299214 [Aspergillus saccharolyticus JOP 1030-1]|uniref:Uncharacterized protein n=1 Tax=Aspergillus saccharolyticus JOP 1030-1 TaxID=1450539 RepID=A0A318ZA98_9EURO|nr:hypothetical protein BP01DRAFT_299214 [Aspergillus saccharolyticus JOP 1030-1]PYH44209.1 hypothetical protein BP01DRAFT_299214 [Aspergillus saccharolyticus JOP 1030-1]